MDITIEKLKDSDVQHLYQFERDNRAFFETMVPSRGDEYYHLNTFKVRHESLLNEQAQGLATYYLIKNKRGDILGRVNLVDINQSQKAGHIGYRVGKSHVGKGIGHKALGLLLESISELDLKELHAKTTNNNIASQKVLYKNGFKHIKTGEDEFEMNGQKLKFLYYTRSMTSRDS
ncbi:GNAT family N-acetyltransferase [Caldalkalibacillus salinus]|uniref:GNAT family N-acetyltransferase n=1 Tax=Caldalkalibacillus salinus TaxID=2803787 RepID=UPI00192307D9|nr:GNAT family N-acetyltransferase [Caldalkalibacillus salinus]